MSATHHEGITGNADRPERSGHEGSAELGETLETHIERIEDAFARADEHRWEYSVLALRDAAAAAGADRILTTASLLRSIDPSDSDDVPGLLDRLRSDGRIYTLEQICQGKEKALAEELSALTPVIERGRA